MAVSGYHAAVALVEALGLKGLPVAKVVIEAGCNSACTVYLKLYPGAAEVGQVAAALKVLCVEDVRVADDATVTYTPRSRS